MPGDDWQKFANLRLLLGYMYAPSREKTSCLWEMSLGSGGSGTMMTAWTGISFKSPASGSSTVAETSAHSLQRGTCLARTRRWTWRVWVGRLRWLGKKHYQLSQNRKDGRRLPTGRLQFYSCYEIRLQSGSPHRGILERGYLIAMQVNTGGVDMAILEVLTQCPCHIMEDITLFP